MPSKVGARHAALCLASGLWLNRAVRQRLAVRHFLALAADRPAMHGEHLPAMLYAHNGEIHSRPILPAWQQPFTRLLGEEAFGELIGVQIQSTPATDDDCATWPICRLSVKCGSAALR